MSEEKNSYKQIFKATSIFGGVQVFNILVSVIRSKFIAIFLGSAGMGIVGLLNSTISLIGAMTNFGLSTSAVKDVSVAHSTGNEDRVGFVVSIVRRWVWATGFLGTFIVLCLSPWLSQAAFGNSNFIWTFALISITLLFNQLNVGNLVVLQGMRKIQYLAKSSLVGSVLGLIVTVPLYYFFGENGIVPALIIASIASFVISKFFAKKVHIQKHQVNMQLMFSEGKNMLKMGFLISFNGLLFIATTYVVQLFISNRGGISQVGLFTAGFSIINTYMGLVFTAMGTDYYPRLSAVANSNELSKKAINQQAEISILILGPVIMVFLVFIKLIILILYSHKFVGIEDMVLWLALATFFKAGSWSIAFLFLAKGKGKLYFWNELFANCYVLLFDLAGYYFWGLPGLGMSCCLSYMVYFGQVFLISKTKFQFSFERSFLKIFAIQFVMAICCFGVVKFVDKPYSYLVGTLFITLSGWFSYYELDKRLGIRMVLRNFLNNKLKG